MVVPGCPDFACWTASMESVWMVLIARWSRSLVMSSNSRFLSNAPHSLGFRRLLQMPTKLVAHGREQLIGVIRFAARAKPLEKGGGQHVGRHALIYGGLDRPAAFAGVGYPPPEFRQCGIPDQGCGREIEQPGGDDGAAAPDLRNVS